MSQVTYVPYLVTLLATHTLWLLYRSRIGPAQQVVPSMTTLLDIAQLEKKTPKGGKSPHFFTMLEYKLQEKSAVAIIKRIELTKRLPRCREVILAKRHQSRKEKKSCQDNEPSDDEDEPMETLQDCIAAVKYAKDDFMTYVKAPRRFFDLLVDEYSKTMPDPEMCGVSDEWRAADGVCRFMSEMIGMVEDILLRLAEGGDGELSIAFMGNELWYQEYKFPV
ncbi:uncharacterized protein F5891DRAFT_986450 [Suillus fuscotomentosus]|uniref:Uncharacterized protein n=1 Tax=Suillus fuscotomentosus TaxID=1912939 RepID=A0AAD4DRV8_9AGAM|nr:uncharacterized protein F5891DRAFT_986450 [Suillus fuscotomentosus]KAG1891891.1 hypothetical protein F5891DRAFT_986450 [Suillus fuscotomentosus]